MNFGSGGFSIRNKSSTPVMWMGNNGRVGVGTLLPEAPLQIGSASYGLGGFMRFIIGNGAQNRIKNIQGISNGTEGLKTLLSQQRGEWFSYR